MYIECNVAIRFVTRPCLAVLSGRPTHQTTLQSLNRPFRHSFSSFHQFQQTTQRGHRTRLAHRTKLDESLIWRDDCPIMTSNSPPGTTHACLSTLQTETSFLVNSSETVSFPPFLMNVRSKPDVAQSDHQSSDKQGRQGEGEGEGEGKEKRDAPRRTLGGSPAASGKPRYSCETSFPSRSPVFSTSNETFTAVSYNEGKPPGAFCGAIVWRRLLDLDRRDSTRRAE